MHLATWNVHLAQARLDRVLARTERNQPDVLWACSACGRRLADWHGRCFSDERPLGQ